MNKLRLATVFSGIGAVEFALKRLNINYKIVFACDNGEREIDYDHNLEYQKIKKLSSIKKKKEYVDNLYLAKTTKKNYVETSYLNNFNCPKSRYFQDICLLDGTDFTGKVDLLVGGSPCQSFSAIGCQNGLDDPRGNLFFEFTRLIKEIQPKVFIYENVRNLLNHNKGNTWKIVKNTFENLGYNLRYKILNSSDYGIPQTRRRLFVVGYKKDTDFDFSPIKKKLIYCLKDFAINHCKFGNFKYDEKGELVVCKQKGEIDSKYVLTPKIYNYVMKSGTKTWCQKPKINLKIARTILKTMGNKHRAGVDNYLSFDGTKKLGSVRMLSEREAHRLMGFTDDYKIVVSMAQAYKQAGNSIVVDVLMAIIRNILDAGLFNL